jgi:hypothetical protein
MPEFQLGDIVRKISGSMWQGAIVLPAPSGQRRA